MRPLMSTVSPSLLNAHALDPTAGRERERERERSSLCLKERERVSVCLKERERENGERCFCAKRDQCLLKLVSKRSTIFWTIFI